jgi:hypothetical protein
MLALTFATTVHIGVLGWFHPAELDVRPAPKSVLVVESSGHSEVLQPPELVHLDGPARITGRKGSFTRFVIRLPNGAEREYFGRLEVRRRFSELELIVEMDRELAVASILAAEGAYALPPEALRAQAIVARSYLSAVHGRHPDFDTCDTTHCQRLGSPPAANSVAAKAALQTRGEVLTYGSKIVPAMYSANCGGHTKAFATPGLAPGDYPFFSVACSRRGRPSGHGVGLCQLGAMDMANAGANAAEILAHYYPGTEIESIDGGAPQPGSVPTAWQGHHRSPEFSRQTLGGPSAGTGGRGGPSTPGTSAPPIPRAPVHAAAS